MKLTIDTKEDSHEDLKKAIKLLQSLVDHPHTNYEQKKNLWDDSNDNFLNMPAKDVAEPEQNTHDLMSMFDSSEEPKQEDKEEKIEDPLEEFKLLQY